MSRDQLAREHAQYRFFCATKGFQSDSEKTEVEQDFLAGFDASQKALAAKIHQLNAFNIDQAFTITKRELMEKLK